MQKIFQEMQQIQDYLNDLDKLLLMDNFGTQLISVEDLIERHKVTEADIGLIGDRVDRVINDAGQFIDQMRNDEQEHVNNPLYQSYKPLLNYEQLIYDRINKLQSVLENTKQLSRQRRDKLTEAHKFWQLMEDIAEEDLWISEKIQQLTVPIGTGADDDYIADKAGESGRYRIKPGVIENEMNAHRQSQFDRLSHQANQLVQSGTFGAEKIENRMNYLHSRWQDLVDLVRQKQDKLTELQETKQFFTDAEDVDSYLYELSRMLTQSAMDDHYVGKDEINVINLLKKHKDLEDEFSKYKQSIINIHDQAANLPSLKRLNQDQVDDAEQRKLNLLFEQVQQRLNSLDRRYNELADMFKLRRGKLNDQLSFLRLQNDVDGIEEWIDEKERFLATLDPTTVKDIEALEVIKHRFVGFEREMNTNAPKIAVVNQLARQLIASQNQPGPAGRRPSAQQPTIDDSIDDTATQALPSGVDLSSNQLVNERINRLNQKWTNLRNLVDKKRDDLNSTFGVQTFHIESQETISWIQDKIRVVQSTEELGNDLSGLMQTQRKLSGLERDLAAIELKKQQLEEQASALEREHPYESKEIRDNLNEITRVWLELKQLLNKREESMGEAAELQKFLRDLDHFSAWLSKTQTAVANTDTPQSLNEAEQMLNQHQSIKEEIDRYAPDYSRMKEFGDRICNNADVSDPQYLFLRERLNALDQGWNILDQMWRSRQLTLSEDLSLEIFKRDAKQAEQLLANQEYYLKQIQQPKSLEDAEALLRKHQDFVTSFRANKDKIDGIAVSARSLSEDQHRDSEAILAKSNDIKKRFQENERRSAALITRLRDSLRYYQFLQDCDDLKEWLECKLIQAQDESYRDTKNIHMKYLRHKAFESEINANRNRLDQLEKDASNLFVDPSAESQPDTADQDYVDHEAREQMRDDVRQRISDLNKQWDELQDTTRVKGEKLFDANRGILFQQSVDSIDIWVKEIEKHLQYTTFKSKDSQDANDLKKTNILLEKQSNIEKELEMRQKQVNELEKQAALLKQTEPEKSDEIDAKRYAIEQRFSEIVQPLEEHKKELQQQKRVFQFLRDCEDEQLWIEEKMRQALSPDLGSSLVEVNMLQRKNETMQKEVDNHEQRIQQVCHDGEAMIEENNPRAEEFQHAIANVLSAWKNLKDAIEQRRIRLNNSQRVQQYFFDCGEAEAWMAEQELYMMSDAISSVPVPANAQPAAQTPPATTPQAPTSPTAAGPADKAASNTNKWCKDELNAQNQLKQHLQLESEVEDHATHIRNLGDISRQLCAESYIILGDDGSETSLLLSGHNTDTIVKRQMQIDKLYASLKDLAQERRLRLEETVKLYVLHRDIDDLEQWIADKMVVADSNELGQDLEHVSLLKERFQQFALDTQQIGQERMNHVGQIANALIDAGHTDSAIIAQWNENLNSSWEDLLELIRTRTHHLQSSWELQKFFSDCKEVLAHIDEKKKCIPEEVGRDAQSVAQLQRRHALFEENDLITLEGRVNQVQEEAAKLHALYAGDRAKEIKDREQEVINEWHNLQRQVDSRRRQLNDINDLYKFFNMSRDLMMWMETQMREMSNEDKPRDVSGVELLINNHQSLKAEIDARAENFTICLNLGRDLLNRHHPRINEVKEKCVQLCLQRDRINDKWLDRWELLQLMLEVYQFARDAAVAEQWLIAQEPYLLNEDLGETLDQVEQLIKKHETFEKSIHAQEERFNALRKLTTLELKNRKSLLDHTDNVPAAAADSTATPAKQADKTNLEKKRLELYLEEFKTIDEREREMESQREQERRIKEAEERLKKEEEAEREKSIRQRHADVIDVTKAMASVGAATMASTSRLTSSPTQPKQGNQPVLFILLLSFFVVVATFNN